MNEVRKLLEPRFAGLHARIEQALVDAEARYNRQAGQAPSTFLLEHTQHTAALAYQLSLREGVDPLVPVLVALFHDAGKFHDGEYHKDGVPEEEHAARLAATMLATQAAGAAVVETVTQSLRALYDERLPCAGACRIVQDADRLDKLGALGVGAFFTKATLRGRGLVDALVHTLGREWTYACAAPRAMLTEAGRTLATERSVRTLAFFEELLQELERSGIAALERRPLVVEGDFRSRDGARVGQVEVTVVTPRTCPECEASLSLSHRVEPGVKCEMLKARMACEACTWAREVSFCLPVFAQPA
jgi:putative nucleotidyltransferase with HDIG domain